MLFLALVLGCISLPPLPLQPKMVQAQPTEPFTGWISDTTYQTAFENGTKQLRFYNAPMAVWDNETQAYSLLIVRDHTDHANPHYLVANSLVSCRIGIHNDWDVEGVLYYTPDFSKYICAEYWIPQVYLSNQWNTLETEFDHHVASYNETFCNITGIFRVYYFTTQVAWMRISYIITPSSFLKHEVAVRNISPQTRQFRIVLRFVGLASTTVENYLGDKVLTLNDQDIEGHWLRFRDAQNPTRYLFHENLEALGHFQLNETTGQITWINDYLRWIRVRLVNLGGDTYALCNIVIGNWTMQPQDEIYFDPSTSTYYSDANGDDAYVYGLNSNYATALTVASAATNNNYLYVGQTKVASNYFVYRVFMKFNTTEILSGDTILSAKLCLYGIFDLSTTNFNILVREWTGDTPITTADYNQYGGTNYGLKSTAPTFPINQYNNITLTSYGVIEKEGYTTICCKSSREGTAPTTDERVTWYAYNKGAGYRPFLEISIQTELQVREHLSASIHYAQRYDWLNTSIRYPSSRYLIINCTLELNQSIILLWDNATDVYSVYADSSNYLALGTGSTKVDFESGDGWTICWNVTFFWNYTEGYIDGNTTCLSAAEGATPAQNDTDTETDWFWFEEDVVVDWDASLLCSDRELIGNPSQSLNFSGHVYYDNSTDPPALGYADSGTVTASYTEGRHYIHGSRFNATMSGYIHAVTFWITVLSCGSLDTRMRMGIYNCNSSGLPTTLIAETHEWEFTRNSSHFILNQYSMYFASPVSITENNYYYLLLMHNNGINIREDLDGTATLGWQQLLYIDYAFNCTGMPSTFPIGGYSTNDNYAYAFHANVSNGIVPADVTGMNVSLNRDGVYQDSDLCDSNGIFNITLQTAPSSIDTYTYEMYVNNTVADKMGIRNQTVRFTVDRVNASIYLPVGDEDVPVNIQVNFTVVGELNDRWTSSMPVVNCYHFQYDVTRNGSGWINDRTNCTFTDTVASAPTWYVYNVTDVYETNYNLDVAYWFTVNTTTVLWYRLTPCAGGSYIVARFHWNTTLPEILDDVQFNASASVSSDAISSWAWDFGDGNTGSGETATHDYSSYGNYTVTLNVTSAAGWNTTYAYITIGSTPDWLVEMNTLPNWEVLILLLMAIVFTTLFLDQKKPLWGYVAFGAWLFTAFSWLFIASIAPFVAMLFFGIAIIILILSLILQVEAVRMSKSRELVTPV